MIVDAHSHLFHPTWYPAAFSAQLSTALGRGKQAPARASQVLLRALADDSGESTLRAMDRAGIDRRLVLIVDWGLELGEAELSIEEIHEAVLGICARFRDRLIGFAGVDPRRPQAPTLLTRAVDDLGARGLKLHPTSSGWTLHDDRTLRLIEIAETRGLIVLVHIGATFPGLTDHNATPAALLALADRFPAVTFVAGHAGLRRWREFADAGPARPGLANLLLDLSGWQSLDDGTEDFAREMRDVVRTFPGRVVFGTDSPFFGLPEGDAYRSWLDRARSILVGEERAAIASFFDHSRLGTAAYSRGSGA